MKKLILCALVLSFGSAAAVAGTCSMTTHREVCPSKPKALDVYKSAKNPTGDPTVEDKSAADAEKCKEMATADSKIKRKRDLAKKTVTAKFDGTDVGTFTETSDCK